MGLETGRITEEDRSRFSAEGSSETGVYGTDEISIERRKRGRPKGSGNIKTISEDSTAGNGTSEEEKESLGFSVIEIETDNEIPLRKKTGRPKKKIVATANISDMADTLKVLTQTGSMLLATRAGAHWIISEDEAKSLADPLSKIMDRYGMNATMGQYVDFMSLAMACVTVILPRAMVSYQSVKEQKAYEQAIKVANASRQTSNTGARTSNGNDGDADSKHASSTPAIYYEAI